VSISENIPAEEARVSAAQAQSLLQQVRLFQGLDAVAIAAISARFHLRTFTAGDLLIEQGRWCGELYILRTGVAQVSIVSSEPTHESPDTVPEIAKEESALRRLVSGDLVGEMSLITKSPPSARVRALTDGDLWALSEEDFQQLILEFPALSRNINVVLSERLFYTSRQQSQIAPQQITLVLTAASPVWSELAEHLALLTGSATLLVTVGDGADPSGTVYRVEDLLDGRLDGALAARDDPSERGPVVAVTLDASGTDDAHAAGAIAGLLGVLGRLEDRYRHVLILMRPDSSHLSPSLLAVVTRVLIAGPAESAAEIRAQIASLPMPASLTIRPEVSVVITDAPSALAPTVATIDRLSERVGTDVRGILPAAATRGIAVGALGRWLAGQRIGLALGGGVVKGWAHLGVIRVLDRLHVPLDCITGVSIGAICAAIIARGGTLDEYETLLRLAGDHAFHPRFSRHGLLSSQAVARFLRRKDVLGERLIEDLGIPYAAVAGDLNTGGEIVIRHGLAWQAALASASIPALFPPVRIGGHVLVDGTVVNPVPISTARILGADKVIAVDISGTLAPRQEISLDGRTVEKLPNMVGAMLRSFEIMGAEIHAHAVEKPSVLIKPTLVGIPLRRFKEGAQYIPAGEAATEAAVPQLYREFPWLRKLASPN
jgi:NTE family protein